MEKERARLVKKKYSAWEIWRCHLTLVAAQQKTGILASVYGATTMQYEESPNRVYFVLTVLCMGTFWYVWSLGRKN